MSPASPQCLQPRSPVPPGRDTGLYYINVAGLPWQCPWQDLKDLARAAQTDGTHISIEHAVVYPGSTNGWVSVRGGRDEFRKVLAHLDGGIIDNRSLIADGRNETEWVHLRDLDVSPSRKHQVNKHSSRGSFIPSRFPCNQPATPPPCSYTYIIPDPSLGWHFPHPSACGPYSSMLPTVFGPPMMQFPSPATEYYSPISVMNAEPNKIILKKLPCGINETCLYDFLQKMLPPDCRAIQTVKIARHSPKEPKRHAFITFNSYADAQTAVAIMDGMESWGCYLQARLVRQGPSPLKTHFPQRPFIPRTRAIPSPPTPVTTSSFSRDAEPMVSPVVSSLMAYSDSSSSLELESSSSSSDEVVYTTPAVVDGSSKTMVSSLA